MDNRGLEVETTDLAAGRKVGSYCLAAMEQLGYRSTGLVVTIEDDPPGRGDVSASAHAGGISISPALIDQEIPLIWTLQEEVAHRYLNECYGVPHGGDFADRFAQEGFAGWFQWRVVTAGLLPEDELDDHPIEQTQPTPALGGVLGRYVGQALAGSANGRKRIDAWLRRPKVPAPLRDCVETLLADLPGDAGPTEMATLVAQTHAAVTGARG